MEGDEPLLDLRQLHNAHGHPPGQRIRGVMVFARTVPNGRAPPWTPSASSRTAGSICAMRRNVHAIIPEEEFECTKGEDALQRYTFNTGVAKHLFCKRCGITPFYRPRSNPHHYAGGPWVCL